MNRSTTVRTPAFGVAAPGHPVQVFIEKPLEEHEIPVVLTRRPSAVIVREVKPTSVVIENRTSGPVVYVLVVVPRSLARLSVVPWQEIVKYLASKQGAKLVLRKIGELIIDRLGAAGR